MPTGTQASVGGKVAAALTNQYGDFPSAVVTVSDVNNRAITSAAYANIPTLSIAGSLVLTRTTLVQVSISGQFGAGAIGTPTNSGFLSFALSGALTLPASDLNSIKGSSPGIPSAGQFTYSVVVPAGTLTGTLQARYNEVSGINIRNHQIQLVAIRAA